MNCLYCGQAVTGRKSRRFCNNAHKQAHWRRQHQEATELAQLRAELAEARTRIAELEQENMRLLNRLDLDHRYHADTQAHTFKAWLKKQPAPSLFMRKLLAQELFPASGPRGTYEAHLRKMKCSTDELREFEHLWKAMLLS